MNRSIESVSAKCYQLVVFPCLMLMAIFLTTSCNSKPPWKIDWKSVNAVVVGKEICNTDTNNDYWIVDVVREGDEPLIGDEVTIDGVVYMNAFKTRDLNAYTKVVGVQVALDYSQPTAERISTSHCEVPNPITYSLRELPLVDSGRASF